MKHSDVENPLPNFSNLPFLSSVDINNPAECHQWQACELDIFLCYRSPQHHDPRNLTPAALSDLKHAFLLPEEGLADLQRNDFVTPFWLQRRGERIGIISLGTTLGSWQSMMTVWSFYLFAEHRGQGIGGEILNSIAEYAKQQGFVGLRIETHWSFQDAVRFYLKQGCWLQNWKRSLVFRHDLASPTWHFQQDGDTAHFSVWEAGEFRDYFQAKQQGKYLNLIECVDNKQAQDGWFMALTTFSLCLAMHGWPLVRSEQSWQQRYHWCDAGYPEGLADKIQRFEA